MKATPGRNPESARRGAARGMGHPASSNRAYDDEESAFLAACEAYRCGRGLRFLKATDYLAILKSLGYRRP